MASRVDSNEVGHDDKPLAVKQAEKLALFFAYSVGQWERLADKSIVGYNLRYRGDWLLVVKAEDNETHSSEVCFIDGESPLECLLTFARKLGADAVKWRPDKPFAGV